MSSLSGDQFALATTRDPLLRECCRIVLLLIFATALTFTLSYISTTLPSLQAKKTDVGHACNPKSMATGSTGCKRPKNAFKALYSSGSRGVLSVWPRANTINDAKRTSTVEIASCACTGTASTREAKLSFRIVDKINYQITKERNEKQKRTHSSNVLEKIEDALCMTCTFTRPLSPF